MVEAALRRTAGDSSRNVRIIKATISGVAARRRKGNGRGNAVAETLSSLAIRPQNSTTALPRGPTWTRGFLWMTR